MNKWIGIYFDGVIMDNIEVAENEVEEIISQMSLSLDDYNEEIVRDWFKISNNKNPKITFTIESL